MSLEMGNAFHDQCDVYLMSDEIQRLEPIVLPHYNFIFHGAGLPEICNEQTRMQIDPDCWVLSRFWVMPVCCPWHEPLEHYELIQVEIEDGLAVAAECCGYPVSWQADTGEPALASQLLGAQTDFYRRLLVDRTLRWPEWRRAFLEPDRVTERFSLWLEFMTLFERARLDGSPYRITENGRCLVGDAAAGDGRKWMPRSRPKSSPTSAGAFSRRTVRKHRSMTKTPRRRRLSVSG